MLRVLFFVSAIALQGSACAWAQQAAPEPDGVPLTIPKLSGDETAEAARKIIRQYEWQQASVCKTNTVVDCSKLFDDFLRGSEFTFFSYKHWAEDVAQVDWDNFYNACSVRDLTQMRFDKTSVKYLGPLVTHDFTDHMLLFMWHGFPTLLVNTRTEDDLIKNASPTHTWAVFSKSDCSILTGGSLGSQMYRFVTRPQIAGVGKYRNFLVVYSVYDSGHEEPNYRFHLALHDAETFDRVTILAFSMES